MEIKVKPFIKRDEKICGIIDKYVKIYTEIRFAIIEAALKVALKYDLDKIRIDDYEYILKEYFVDEGVGI